MLIAGLTGGIGSGKSLVAQIFNHLHTPVFNADEESKIILMEDPEVRQKLSEWFGNDIYIGNQPDRQKIARIIFTDPALLVKMNQLMHPKVMERFINWCRSYQNKPYVIHEAAILFESGFNRKMDVTILVTAPVEIRISRVMIRDRVTEEAVRQRMANQWSDEQKAPLASYIIENDGESPLVPRIIEIHNKLIA
jgi:dephospho-CoA kinase